ncbi:MAG TPA: acetyl-CoA C-acyltransferase [Gaiellales bacterium]|nr:acetyl-CoA C-acyltransferase [Gaiellales bacterium]
MPHTVILSAARTPFGRLGGALSSRTAVQLGVVAASAAFQRAGVEPSDIDYAVIGQVVQAGAGHIPSRQVTLAAGVPDEIGSDTVNKVCASGMRAVALADLMVRAGDQRLLLAGGMESMSSAPYLLSRARSGYRFGDGELLDANLRDGLRDPWSGKLMYEQASAVADELGLTRGELDEWALRSHQRAVAAIDSGRMAEEIVAVEVPERGGPALIDTDEAPRRDTTLERLAALPPLDHAHPTHTAGNSPGVNDGAAMLVVADADLAQERNLEPLARILATGCTANRHDSLARVPARAAQIALGRAGLTAADMDVIEINEAFASVALQSSRDLGVDPDRVNVNGGAVALGHPVGASGARLVGTLVYELRRRGGGRGLAAICSGGGQGDAIVIEVGGS